MANRRLAPPEIQPKDFAFTAENMEWAKTRIAKYPAGRQASAIIPLLWRAQEQSGGWLPQKAIEYVGDMLGMERIRALEVATFYTMFNLEPVGQFHVQLCGTTPCVLRGADKLIKLCHDKIGEQFHVTADGKLSWVEVECLGACVNAPVAQISAKPADILPATTPVSEFSPDLKSAVPATGDLAFIRTRDKILLVRTANMIVVDEIAAE